MIAMVRAFLFAAAIVGPAMSLVLPPSTLRTAAGALAGFALGPATLLGPIHDGGGHWPTLVPPAHAEESGSRVINQLWAEPDSDLVRTLRERSEAKREERMKQMVQDYNEKNFASYFEYSGQKLARKSDGTYDLLSMKEYRKAELAGDIDKGAYTSKYYEKQNSQ